MGLRIGFQGQRKGRGIWSGAALDTFSFREPPKLDETNGATRPPQSAEPTFFFFHRGFGSRTLLLHRTAGASGRAEAQRLPKVEAFLPGGRLAAGTDGLGSATKF